MSAKLACGMRTFIAFCLVCFKGLQNRPLEKLKKRKKIWGGEGGIVEMYEFFSLTFPLQEYIFFRMPELSFWATRCA